MRVSRPCYDKPHRCPGWAGGGWEYGRADTCDNGSIPIDYESRWWRLKVHRCPRCGVTVLPYAIRLTSWRTWLYRIQSLRR